MHFPINLVIGSMVIPAHLVFDMLAFFVGISLLFRLNKSARDPLEQSQREWVIVGAIAGAFFGAVLLGVLEHFSVFFVSASMTQFISAKTIVGGLVGGLIGVEITKKILCVNQSSGDFFVIPLIVSMMIGRIGCFLTGVSDATVGNPSVLPWAMDQGDGVLRHPTSLYEIFFLAILLVGLIILSRRKFVPLSNGMKFKYFLFSYCVYRFLIEFIKPVVIVGAGLSAIQITCLLCAGYYALWHGRDMVRELFASARVGSLVLPSKSQKLLNAKARRK